MKVIRYLAVLLSLSVVLMLQGCGDETGGALSMTALTSSQVEDSYIYDVATKVTYTPPSGKSAQGVVVTIVSTYLNATGISTTVADERTLTSNSNSFDYGFAVKQFDDRMNAVSIVVSIGSMTASSYVVIPVRPVVAAT
ncbi:MAG: hypothetical protein ACYDG4_01955 [Desulfuromonadaceae bacterium]